MELVLEREHNIEKGDIIVADDNKVRMVIYDDYNDCYSVIDLEGNLTMDWHDDIESMLENYKTINRIYKNKELKIVSK